jgi:hypothetical protein
MSVLEYWNALRAYIVASLAKRKELSFVVGRKIESFGNFDDRGMWDGLVPSLPLLKNVYAELSLADKETKTRYMMSLTGNVLCGDHTFKVCRYLSSNPSLQLIIVP